MNYKTLVNTLFFVLVVYCINLSKLHGEPIAKNTSLVLAEDIADILDDNANTLNSLSIALQRTRSTDMSLESLLKQIDCLYEYGFLSRSNQVYIWQSPCFYYFSNGYAVVPEDMNKIPFAYEKNLKLNDIINEFSFNGKEFMSGCGNEWTERTSPALGIDSKEQAIRDIGKKVLFDSMYMLAAGYRFPIVGNDIGSSQNSCIIDLLKQGKIYEMETKGINGEEYFFVNITAKDIFTDSDRSYTFWLMPKYRYATKKMQVKTLNGKMVYEIENNNFVKIDNGGVYLPKSCRINYYSWNTKPEFISNAILFTEIFSLAEVSTKQISQSQFDLRKKYSGSGTVIADRTLIDSSSGVQYIIPANPADLDRVIEAALTGGTFIPTPLPSTGAIIVRWLLIIAGIAMILYSCYFKFVKKSNK